MLIRTKINRKLISIILILVMTFSGTVNSIPVNVHAAKASKDTSSVYLDETSIYLHLVAGKQGTHNINIHKNTKSKVTACTWFVDTGKGDPDAVTVNKNTGTVTAKKAGTAYIGCKVTLADGTVRKPEATVTVRNNITGVKINNIPKDRTITAGMAMNFNRTILNTEGGKGKKTQGVTRWEIKDDTAGIGAAENNGTVYPANAGSFKIRAVAFQSKAKYSLWLKDKEANAGNITAVSKWLTIQVVPSDGKAIVNTKEQLKKALAIDKFNEITLSTKSSETFIIKEGNYSSKTLIVDAPNADVENHGIFKIITIKAIKDTTWIEYSDGNIIHLLDTQSRIVVGSGAQIKQIVVDTPNAVLNLEISGTIDKISVLQPATVNLSGSSSSTAVPLSVEAKAGGSKITSSIPLNLTLNANTELVLEQGAEETSIDKSAGSIEVNMNNNTKKPVIITTNKTGGETIDAGKRGISNAATASANSSGSEGGSGTSGNTVSVTGLRISPSTMVLSLPGSTQSATGSAISVTGSAISCLVAVITPENAANATVTWNSGDPTVATVDSDGIITPVGIGTTPIIAEVGGIYATATVTVVSGSALSVTGSAVNLKAESSFASKVVKDLADGAVSFAGGEIFGWGLGELGVHFPGKDATTEQLEGMAEELAKISTEIKNLGNKVEEATNRIINQTLRSEFNVRAGQMIDLISSIKSLNRRVYDFVHDDSLSKEQRDRDRADIIATIGAQLKGKEDAISMQLCGDNTQESLISVFSKILKTDHRFLSAEDSAAIQDMFNYYEMMQACLLELLVEYYHAQQISGATSLINEYYKNIAKQKAMLKQPVPESVLIDRDQNIMIYTGYHVIKLLTYTFEKYKGPYYGDIQYMDFALSTMCYKLNYGDWHVITESELESWINASSVNGGHFNQYLKDNGFHNSMLDERMIATYDYVPGNTELPNLDTRAYDIYNFYDIASGKNKFELVNAEGHYHAGSIYAYLIVCRTLSGNGLADYFY